jgi:predicted histone-like DNA-binding protein
MKYKITKETKPRLSTYGQYKAVACHQQEISTEQIISELKAMGYSEGTVVGIMTDLSNVINRHLRQGDKVRLEDLGLLKLEIESDVVNRAEDFSPGEHIRGVRLHFLPESTKGKPKLYQDLEFEREKE